MKRIVLASVAAFGLMIAQTTYAQVQVGFRGGANWSYAAKPDFLGSVTPNLLPSPGPTGALFLDIPLSTSVSFRPEIAYVQKGFLVKESYDLKVGGFTLPLGARIAYQSQTLEVPLLFKINLTDGPVQPYLIAGPSVSYALDGRVRTRATALVTTRPIDVNVNYGGMLNRWDASAVGGLGLAMDAGAGKFFIEGRYTYGFTRQVQVPLVNVNVRNRGVAMSVGYSFPIGR